MEWLYEIKNTREFAKWSVRKPRRLEANMIAFREDRW
jgi:hypothetical protein